VRAFWNDLLNPGQPGLFELPSVLSPAGEAADTIAFLSWVLIIGAALIFAVVMLLLAWAVARREDGGSVRPAWWIVGGGLAFPAVVVTALFFYSGARTPAWQQLPPPGSLIVGITAHRYWWEVRYRDLATGRLITLANELHLPVDRPVWIGLNSADVIHSFWVPALAGKIDMVPGRVNRLVLNARRAGVFRGQCAEFCGEQHARMALHVVTEPAEAFNAWLAAQAGPAVETDAPNLARGRQAFLDQRCNACHTVRGVAEESSLGPDLTHVGSRLYLGAGTLPNQPGNVAHWVAHTQAVKPGARMPSATDMDAATLQALAAWLEQLK
jgi:cytochrome c oxidase subunit II